MTTGGFLRNRWYVAALGEEFGADPLARTILGEPVVLFRDSGGRAGALEDRCVHRQAPLSLGEVVGDTLQCGYHGFAYDRTGACVLIPSQDRIPPGACVRAYPVIERGGLVFVWPGEPDRADATAPYDFPPPFAEETGWDRRRVHFLCAFDYRLLMDNLLDLTHLAYVHAPTIGAAAMAQPDKVEIEREAERVRVVRTMENTPPAPAHVEATGETANVDRWQVIDYAPPAFVWVVAGNARLGKGGRNAPREDVVIERHTLHAATPETATTTHYFFTSSMREGELGGDARDGFWRRTMDVLAEDIAIIEGQQARLTDARPTVDVGQDASQLAMRRILDRLTAEEAGAARAASTA